MPKNLTHGKFNQQQQITLFLQIDNEERAMHSKSDKIEIMINDEADEVLKELFS